MVKKKRAGKWIGFIGVMVLIMIVSIAGCTSPQKQTDDVASPSSTTTSSADKSDSGEVSSKGGSDTFAYPIKTDQTVTYWGVIPGNLAGVKSTHADLPFIQDWQKNTGVKIEFSSPAGGQVNEALNVMLASGELPDLIEYNWYGFGGGPEKAINDGYIIALNEAIGKWAPNLKKFLQEHPDIDKMVKTDNGTYYEFPFIRGDDILRVWQGIVIRQDWLDDLGLPLPETIDEWHTTLKAFREQKGAAAPLSFNSGGRPLADIANGAFVSAFGVVRDFYLADDGSIKYGPAEQGYKDFLATFHQWYVEGLLDKNVATTDLKTLDFNIATGATGATVGAAGSGIGKWMPLVQEKDPKAVLAGTKYPVLKKGDTPFYGQKDAAFTPAGTVAITSRAKDIELLTRLMDYGYSEEGNRFFNYGTEGVSYHIADGIPRYSDLLMKNPDGLSPAQAISLYARGNTNGPFVQDKHVIDEYYGLPQQLEALDRWSLTDTDKYKLPPITPTPEESSEFSKIMADVNTLVDEMTVKIILGAEPVDKFDSYIDKLKSVKLDRAIEIKEAALQRYNQR